MYDQKTVSSKLRSKRAERGVNQEQLAEALDVARNTVSRWELGDGIMPLDKVWELADYYGCTVDELIGRKQEA